MDDEPNAVTLPNHTYYSIPNVIGVSFKACPCWKDVSGQPSGSWKKRCTDPTHVDTCEATVRCVGGIDVEYTFTCNADSNAAGWIHWDAQQSLLTVWNWLTET